MIAGIADTHTLIWYLYGDAHLSAVAKAAIDTAFANGDTIGVSPISLVEAIYLAEKDRIWAEVPSRILTEVLAPDTVFVGVPLDFDLAQALARVDRAKVPDMPDRIIAATALHVNAPIISRDAQIQVSGVETIW